MENMGGKFIVFEGLDGSGKATQVRLLEEHLKKEGFKVEKTDFPRHGESPSYFVDSYLNGKYGTAEEVGPFRGSIFYALDRYDASFKIKEWLNEGKMVLGDRYVASNIGHQGGKIEDRKKRSDYFKWVFDLEYNLFGIPKPNLSIILKTSPEFSLKMSNNISDKDKIERRKAYLGDDKSQDIHEKESDHQSKALDSYMQVAEEYPNDFKIIDCVSNGRLLTSEEIHPMVWDLIKNL